MLEDKLNNPGESVLLDLSGNGKRDLLNSKENFDIIYGPLCDQDLYSEFDSWNLEEKNFFYKKASKEKEEIRKKRQSILSKNIEKGFISSALGEINIQENLSYLVGTLPNVVNVSSKEVKKNDISDFVRYVGKELLGFDFDNYKFITNNTSSEGVGVLGEHMFKIYDSKEKAEREVKILGDLNGVKGIARVVKEDFGNNCIFESAGKYLFFTDILVSHTESYDYINEEKNILDPIKNRLNKLNYIHNEFKPDKFIMSDYEGYSDLSLKKLENIFLKFNEELNPDIKKKYGAASRRQKSQYKKLIKNEGSYESLLCLTHGDAKWDNWVANDTALIDFGSAKCSTPYKDIAKSLLDMKDITNDKVVDEYIDYYYGLSGKNRDRIINSRSFNDSEKYEAFKTYVYDALLTESIRTLYYKSDKKDVANQMIKIANYYSNNVL